MPLGKTCIWRVIHDQSALRGVIGFAAIKLWLLFSCVLNVKAEATFYGPAEYLSLTNTSLSNISGFNYFYLETFEDGLLNTPGVLINSGWIIIGPGTLTDSVDADDGVINDSGASGYSLLSADVQTNLTVTFIATNLGGHLPTHVGVVCTDIGAVFFGQLGVGDVTFSARDANGMPLGSITATNVGNGSVQGSGPGATTEDRFFGVSNPGGVSTVTLSVNNSMDWEADHLQYGYPPMSLFVPELRIRQSVPNEVVLSWSTNAIGFTLQEAGGMSGTNWTTVTIPPTLECEENQVTVTPLSSNRFYRLIGP